MDIKDIISEKRDNNNLSAEQIDFFINGYTNGKIPDYQISPLLMAIYLNSMSKEEMSNLTISMINTGEVLDFKSHKKVVDKHSTGGVGDKTSLVLIPLLASLGFEVSKMSGRGLGHTGGTIDKLESFKGFNVEKTKEEIYEQIEKIGCVIVGQSDNIVPADKKLYALRDVTATVGSIPLIAASIMSKKIALGADIILLDVKYGSGAFMKSKKNALHLSKAMIDIGNNLNKKTIACITSMNQPLGKNIGNILEVQEAMNTLQNKGNEELKDFCIELAVQYLIIDETITKKEAKKMAINKLENGEAYKKFEHLLIKQGVKKEDIDRLEKAKYTYEYKLNKKGYIKSILTDQIGLAIMHLGAGRQTKEDKLDLSVGFEMLKKIGDYVKEDETCIIIHYNDENKLNNCLKYLENTYELSDEKVQKPKLIEQIIK